MMKKIYTYIYQFLFILPFILLLIISGNDQMEVFPKILFISIIGVLLMVSITQRQFYAIAWEKDELKTIPFVVIGTICTYCLQYYFSINPILSAGIVGFTSTLFPPLNKYAIPIYCGAFVGMTNPSLSLPLWLMSFNGLMAGILFYFGKNFYGGIGGKLGTIAFAAVLFGVLMYKAFLNGYFN